MRDERLRLQAGRNISHQLSMKVDLSRQMTNKNWSEIEQHAMFRFLQWLFALPEEMEDVYEETIQYDEDLKSMATEQLLTNYEKMLLNKHARRAKEECKREIAQKMLSKKLPVKLIAECSGFSMRDISKWKKQLEL